MDSKKQLGFFLHIYLIKLKEEKTHQNDAKTEFQIDQYIQA